MSFIATSSRAQRARLAMAVGLPLLLVRAVEADAHAAGKEQTAQCVAHHQSSQSALRERRLLEARQHSLQCAVTECPGLIRHDCVGWLDELKRSTPSVVLLAQTPDGKDVVDTQVTMDGARVAASVDGKALEVDPGEHRFRFEAAGMQPVEVRMVIVEGRQSQQVVARFAPPPAPVAPVAPVATAEPRERTAGERRLLPLTIGLGVVGVVGLGIGSAFAVSGLSQRGDLVDSGCRPNCSPDATRDISSTFLVADVSLLVGIVSLAGAAVTYLLDKPRPVAASR